MKIINKQPVAFLRNLTKAYTEGIYADTPANRKLGRVGMSYSAYAEKTKRKEEKENSSKDKKTNYFGTDADLKNIANKLNDLLKYKGLSARVTRSNIEIYKKGDVFSLKNLLAAIYSKDYISWGPYENNVGLKNMIQGTLNKVLKENETEILVNKTETLKNAEGKTLDAIIKYSNSAKEEGVEGIKVAKDATDNEKRIAIAKFYKEAAEDDAENLDEILEDALADYTPEKEKKEKIALSDISVQGEDRYKFVIGKSPKGRGNWAFKIGNDDVNKDPSKIFFVEGMYEEAKNKAKKEAQKRGNIYSVTLLP